MTNPNQTKSIWQSWSGTTKFSVIAFVVSEILSLLSMGALGYLVYYAVAPLLPESIDTLNGDSVWPSVIFAGMVWSVGFLLAGLSLHYLKPYTLKTSLKYLAFAVILWVWDYLTWFWIIHFSIVQ
jgi:hypothetical protein